MAGEDKMESLKSTRHRSPNYPAISLENALERARKIYDADGQAGSPIEVACQHIGFNGTHGQAMAVVSALKKFALVDDKNGRIVPTKLAIELFNFPRENIRHIVALKQAALNPDIYRQLYERYLANGGRLPSDASLKPELVTDKGFNPKAVDGFLADFRRTLEFAGLLIDNTLRSPNGTDDVRDNDNDNDNDNEMDGGMEEAIVPSPAVDVARARRQPNAQPQIKQPDFAGHLLDAVGTTCERTKFSEGPVVLLMPEKLSGASVADFEYWTNGIIQKLRRDSGAHKSKILSTGEQLHLIQHPNQGWRVNSYEWSWLAGMSLQTSRVFAQQMGWEDIEFDSPEQAVAFVQGKIESGEAPGKPKR